MAAGFVIGRAPWGFEVVCAEGCGPVKGKRPHGKTLAPTPEGIKYVPEIFQRLCDGESLGEISMWLKARDWLRLAPQDDR